MMSDAPLTLIALHGNGGGAFRFARCAPHMPSDVRFVALTLNGFADVPRDPALQTMRDYAQRLACLIADAARPRVLLGHGIGGAFVLELIQAQPEAVDAIILHAPVGTRLDRRRFPKLMKPPFMRALGKWLFSAPFMRPVWQRVLFRQPVPADYLQQFFAEYRRCAVFGQMFDLITAEWFKTLRPSAVRAGLLWGARERVLKVEHVQDYKALLPRHVVRIVPEWDHFPMIEQPSEYAAEVSALARQVLAL
jgi:pimeloyl-ACP methyl ester carboxylesterase